MLVLASVDEQDVSVLVEPHVDMGASGAAVNDELRSNGSVGIPVNAAGVYSNVRGSVNVPLGLALKAAVVVLSHVELLLESGEEIYSPRSGASQAQRLWAKRWPLRCKG